MVFGQLDMEIPRVATMQDRRVVFVQIIGAC